MPYHSEQNQQSADSDEEMLLLIVMLPYLLFLFPKFGIYKIRHFIVKHFQKFFLVFWKFF